MDYPFKATSDDVKRERLEIESDVLKYFRALESKKPRG